ncbi:ParD-like family protein [Methylobacter sp. G7]|uniref:ParD-like family protein n=1 Tax=Methylobacter sp. G7 TaxID=3230117 RepID=UPI003D808EC6
MMGIPVRIDNALYDQARAQAHAERRTIAGQIEFWALIGRTALDNPDLPIDFVRDLLIARAEGPTLATPFVAEGKRN